MLNALQSERSRCPCHAARPFWLPHHAPRPPRVISTGSAAWPWHRWGALAGSRWRCGGTGCRRSAPRSPRTVEGESQHPSSWTGPSPPGSARTSPCRLCLRERNTTEASYSFYLLFQIQTRYFTKQRFPIYTLHLFFLFPM